MKKKIVNMILVGLILAGIDSMAYAQAVDNSEYDVDNEVVTQLECSAWSGDEEYTLAIYLKTNIKTKNEFQSKTYFSYQLKNLDTGKEFEGSYGYNKDLNNSLFYKSQASVETLELRNGQQIKIFGDDTKHYRLLNYDEVMLNLFFKNGHYEVQDFNYLFGIGDYLDDVLFPKDPSEQPKNHTLKKNKFTTIAFQKSYCEVK